jgi:hypothetical protein
MIQRLLLYFAVVLVIVVLATSFNRFVLDKKKTVNEVIVETSDFFKVEKIAESEQQPKQLPVAAAAPSNTVSEKFKAWFREETVLISSTQINTENRAIELRERAKSFSAQEIDFIKQKITDPSAPQDEKILSTYLLSLTGSVDSLSEVASRTMGLEAAEPHSLKEIQNNQERAKAIMAIDAIADSGLPLSLRINELGKIINRQDDVSVKNYAQRKQSELQSEL